MEPAEAVELPAIAATSLVEVIACINCVTQEYMYATSRAPDVCHVAVAP